MGYGQSSITEDQTGTTACWSVLYCYLSPGDCPELFLTQMAALWWHPEPPSGFRLCPYTD